MQVHRFTDLDELSPHAARWNELAQGNPFRRWEWIANWCRHYDAKEPYFVAAFDASGTLQAALPWVLDRSPMGGAVLHFAGDGEVCSEYLGLLAEPAMAEHVIPALARWLSVEQQAADRWDRINLAAMDSQDSLTARLVAALGEAGHRLIPQAGFNCWRLDLPHDWEAYLARLSPKHRKQLRKLKRDYLDTGRAVFHEATNAAELARGFDILLQLHQKRRRALGQPGCFESKQFLSFHRAVSACLLKEDALRLSWLEIEGQPAAAEYHLAAKDTIYAYQAGVDPDLLKHEPGRIIAIAFIERALARGVRAIDFLRGDEPYKQHWRAEPRLTSAVHIVSKRATAQLRHKALSVSRRIAGVLNLSSAGGRS